MPGGGWIVRTVSSRMRTSRSGSGRAGSRYSKGGANRTTSYRNVSSGGYIASLGQEMNYLFMQAVVNEESIAAQGYTLALQLCGNQGQIAIIEKMGMSSFHRAVSASVEYGDAHYSLSTDCKHPEAVDQILIEAGGLIDELVEDRKVAASTGDL